MGTHLALGAVRGEEPRSPGRADGANRMSVRAGLQLQLLERPFASIRSRTPQERAHKDRFGGGARGVQGARLMEPVVSVPPATVRSSKCSPSPGEGSIG